MLEAFVARPLQMGLWMGAGGLAEDNGGGCCSHGAYVLDEIWTSAFLGFGGFRRCEKMLLLLPNGSQILLTTGPVLSLRVKVTRTSWICPSPISSSGAEGAGRGGRPTQRLRRWSSSPERPLGGGVGKGRLGRMGSGREMVREVLRRMGLWFLHRKHQKVFCTAAFSTKN